jgi:hypothetical protein
MAQQMDWIIVPEDIKVTTVAPQPRHTYDLFNVTTAEALVYQERDWGINLGWGDPAKSSNIRFERKSGSREPIKFGELVAINVRRGNYLVYKRRDTGINLGWSNTPKFEWRIMGGEIRDAVKIGDSVGLFSTVENDYLMYERRDWGINLKWYKDSGRFDDLTQAADFVKRVKEYSKKIAALVG